MRAYAVLLNSNSISPAIGALSIRPRTNRRFAVASVAGLILLIATAMIAWLAPWRAKTESGPEARTPLTLPSKPSIAVLPFTNMSADPEQAYFSDGMTDDLITNLSKVAKFFVMARNSTFS